MNCSLVRKESRWATGLIVLGITAFFLPHAKMEELALPKQEQQIQTQPLPNMVHVRIPLPDLPGMFRLGEALDFPADLVHEAGVAKAAFSAGLLVNFTWSGRSAVANSA